MSSEGHFKTHLATPAPWNEGSPTINAAHVFGARPDSPVFLPIPACGERPLRFVAEGLPPGLALEAETGIVRGHTTVEGEFSVGFMAANRHGTAVREIDLIIGDGICLTPPLGWNSWNVWGRDIDEAKVRDCAARMVGTGLAAHGFSYINIDDGWQGERGRSLGALQPNDKFGDMAALCRDLHTLGLRVGIYSTPWVRSYAGYAGGSSGECIRCEAGNPEAARKRGRYFGEVPHHAADARQWAAWGIDYLKYDWGPWRESDVAAMANALREAGRDIVYSLSNSAPFAEAAVWSRLANCWRTTGDITDTWESVSRIGFAQDRWTPYARPGHWNDPDMLVVGELGWGTPRANRLSCDEQITHLSLWALLAAPLLLGCDLSRLDDFTIALMSNDGMLAINQDPGGSQGHCLREVRRIGDNGQVIVHEALYVRDLADGSHAVGLFNRADEDAVIEFAWEELGLNGRHRVRDVWGDRELGQYDDHFAMGVPAHGAQLLHLA